MSAEQNRVLVRRFFEVQEDVNRRKTDLEALDEILAPDFVSHTKLLPGQQPGREGYKRAIAEILATGSNTRFLIEEQVAEGDKVVTRFRSRGTHQGETEAFGPPTGNQFEVTGITIEQFSEEGKIVEDWTNIDALGLMQQLGLVPEQQQ